MAPGSEWVKKFYELHSTEYLPTSDVVKTRVESSLPRLLKHLPRKGSRVLDLCCGAGACLFALEKSGYEMTGLDIQEQMISNARKIGRKSGSKATLVLGDAMAPRLPDESFDAIIFMGAPFAHFSLEEFARIAKHANRMLVKRGTLIAELNDHVALFLSGMYQRILYEPSGDRDVVSIHTRYDGEKGTFNRLILNLETNRRFKGSFFIWTPWILDYIMREASFKRVASEPGSFGSFSRLLVYRKL